MSIQNDSQPQSARVPSRAGTLLVGVIELATPNDYRVRLLDGEVVAAKPATGCEPALLSECLRERRTVMLSYTPDGPLILGALQTRSSATETRDGLTQIDSERIELNADSAICLRVGGSTVELRKDGTLRIAGQRLTMDIATLVKVLSGRVELP